MAAAGWALALSWWSSRPWVPLFGRLAVQASKTLGGQNLDVPLRVACLPLLERGRGHMTDFGEDCDRLFGSASRRLEFHRWALIWEKPD